MAEKKYRVLVVGAGWVATQHIAAYKNNPATEVVALTDHSLDIARQRAAEMGLANVALYDDMNRALEHDGIEIVSVCTPQHVHAENVVAAAAAGKHIVIEKPVATGLEELRTMRDAVRQAKVKTVVSFVLRWNPLFQTAKSMIADGALGNIYCVETDYLHNISSYWSGYADARRADWGISAHLVGGCHAIDAMRWFAAGEEFKAADPVEVFSYAGGWRKGSSQEFNYLTGQWGEGVGPLEYDGLEMTMVRFANGVVGKVSVNFDCIMPYNFPVRIFGSKGTMLDNRVWSHKYPGQKGWVEIPTILPDSGDVSHHPFQGEIDHFVECLQNGVDSHCNLDDAVKTHEVVFAAQECYRTGKPVQLPLL